MTDATEAAERTEPVDGSAGDEDLEPMSFQRRTARVLAVLASLLVAGIWAYALWGPHLVGAPGVLTDKTFPVAAQSICTQSATVISALPPAFASANSGARAEVVTQANVELALMLKRLDAIAPPAADGKDATMISEWLTDWHTYVGDREAYAVALESDPKARLYVTQKDNQQISKPIDFFATYNKMENCMTPGDLA
jgi:hypothetical protein